MWVRILSYVTTNVFVYIAIIWNTFQYVPDLMAEILNKLWKNKMI